MAKYKINIPPPNAKRMIGRGVLIIQFGDNWNGFDRRTIFIGNNTNIEFELPDRFIYVYENNVFDGPEFNIWVEYANEAKTRFEKHQSIPKRIHED